MKGTATACDHRSILVDAHVHYHPCFDPRFFLNAAANNFRDAACRLASDARWIGFLMLADTHAGDGSIQQLDGARRQLEPEWRLEPCDESCSVLAYRNDRLQLVLVAGRQLVTAEGIELLALATGTRIPERRPLRESLDAIVHANAIPVIPWGFGKWSFRRGKVLMHYLTSVKMAQSPDREELFLGDNAGRIDWLGEPRLFTAAKERGIRILPGSDPLPFASHVNRPGSFGFELSGPVDLRRPALELKKLLAASPLQPPVFGRLARVHGFVANQFAMQFRKRVAVRSQ